MSRKSAARQSWRAAQSFEDLCELAARFVEGELAFFPGWASGALDRESEPHVDSLALLNRAALLTLASQPGLAPTPSHDGSLAAQRAFVCGFATEATALRIERSDASSSLQVAIFRPGERGGDPTPVSKRNEVAYAFAGYAAFEDELACFEDHCSPAALRALAACCYVSVVDLDWGRNTELWKQLERALAP